MYLQYSLDPVLDIRGESKSNVRGQIGDPHALRNDLNRLLGHDTHLFQTQTRTKTFFVSKKLPHLTETKPATVYSWILVERTGKSGARGKEQYLRGGEAGGVEAPRQFPASGGEDGFFRRR